MIDSDHFADESQSSENDPQQDQESTLAEKNQIPDEADTNAQQEESVEAQQTSEDAPSQDDEIADLKDKLQRTLAELENSRRRFEREKQDMTKYAIAHFATDVLHMADNLERALNAIGEDIRKQDENFGNFITGVELTARELAAIFERNHITKIEPKGEMFSYNHHQAVSEIESAEHQAGTVIEVLQPGYLLHDRLIRPAMVVVAKGKS